MSSEYSPSKSKPFYVTLSRQVYFTLPSIVNFPVKSSSKKKNAPRYHSRETFLQENDIFKNMKAFFQLKATVIMSVGSNIEPKHRNAQRFRSDRNICEQCTSSSKRQSSCRSDQTSNRNTATSNVFGRTETYTNNVASWPDDLVLAWSVTKKWAANNPFITRAL